LGRKLPDAVWNELVGEKRVWTGHMTWDEEELLVGDAKSYLRARQGGARDPNSDGRRLTPSAFLRNEHWLRREVFAVCIAAMANEHPEVRAFREEILGELFPLTYDGACASWMKTAMCGSMLLTDGGLQIYARLWRKLTCGKQRTRPGSC